MIDTIFNFYPSWLHTWDRGKGANREGGSR